MRCGETGYVITYEKNGARTEAFVPARTPADARKKFRRLHGEEATIVSVIRQKGVSEQ